MHGAFAFIGDWGHALAAALYAALAIWASRGRDGTAARHLLAAALALTSFWALYTSFGGAVTMMAGIAESMRNFAWLLFMFTLLRRGEGSGPDQPMAVMAIYGVLGALLAMQCMADIFLGVEPPGADRPGSIFYAAVALRMMVAVGALVLVHNLYTMSAPEARWGIRLPMAALAMMWTYDLNLYTIDYLSQGDAAEFYAMRGPAMALLAPVFALGLHRNDQWRLRLSRAVTFQSLSLVAIGVYLMAMVLVAAAAALFLGPYARLVQISFVFGMSVAALVLTPSAAFRAWFRVKVAKHFFAHRYDYRTEWMRFTDTVGRPDEGAAPLNERVVKAVADITDSPAGMLLLAEEGDGLALHALWNWPARQVPVEAMSGTDAAALLRTGWIVELDSARAGEGAGTIPRWMLDDASAWVLLPLIHFDRLIGAILLARPRMDRRPDWEDLDMLRVVGRQAASYISEAQGQQALSDAQRFDEFNRRFAFIMHDIKNLVSQLSLLARNAERHAGNPDFRADMVLTLKESVGRMNDLLARLSQHNKGRAEEPRAIALRPLLEAMAGARRHQHPVHLSGAAAGRALADPVRVEQILAHLLQNAIDASAPDRPVILNLGERPGHVIVAVIDQGSGMSADYIRRELFKPFSSSKPGGFGIGAYEARTLASAMNGRIEVESREGEGSCFTLILPAAPETPSAQAIDQTIEEKAA